MPHRNLILICVAVAACYVCHLRAEQNPYARYVATGYTAIDALALEQVPRDELFAGAMRGMVDQLKRRGDAHSQFITPEDAQQFRAEMRQQIGGIGVRIRMDGDPPQLTIAGPPEPGTPAFESDLRAGDKILAIDDQATTGMELAPLLRLMRGEAGEPIRLSVLHPGAEAPVTIALVRSIIPLHSILGDRREQNGRWQFFLEDDQRIAYIRITTFGDKTATELRDTFEQLAVEAADGKRPEIQAAILDLRENAGGALDVAVDICDMFLPAGKLIVETRGRDSTNREREVSSGEGRWQELPLVVLINRNSASASEIMAAALQDHHRAVIVGERSFGKGTVQQIINLGTRGESLLKLTLASFWRPNGKNIHRRIGDPEQADWGVRPDDGFAIPQTDEEYLEFRRARSNRDIGESEDSVEFADEALRRARDYLRGSLSQPAAAG